MGACSERVRRAAPRPGRGPGAHAIARAKLSVTRLGLVVEDHVGEADHAAPVLGQDRRPRCIPARETLSPDLQLVAFDVAVEEGV